MENTTCYHLPCSTLANSCVIIEIIEILSQNLELCSIDVELI